MRRHVRKGKTKLPIMSIPMVTMLYQAIKQCQLYSFENCEKQAYKNIIYCFFAQDAVVAYKTKFLKLFASLINIE